MSLFLETRVSFFLVVFVDILDTDNGKHGTAGTRVCNGAESGTRGRILGGGCNKQALLELSLALISILRLILRLILIKL